MPIYEYECKKCGYKFEQLQKMTDQPVRICPKCKKVGLAKLVSNTSFQLKGTGWYVTDFKDNSDKKAPSNSEQTSKKQDAKPLEKPGSTEKKIVKN